MLPASRELLAIGLAALGSAAEAQAEEGGPRVRAQTGWHDAASRLARRTMIVRRW